MKKGNIVFKISYNDKTTKIDLASDINKIRRQLASIVDEHIKLILSRDNEITIYERITFGDVLRIKKFDKHLYSCSIYFNICKSIKMNLDIIIKGSMITLEDMKMIIGLTNDRQLVDGYKFDIESNTLYIISIEVRG